MQNALGNSMLLPCVRYLMYQILSHEGALVVNQSTLNGHTSSPNVPDTL